MAGEVGIEHLAETIDPNDRSDRGADAGIEQRRGTERLRLVVVLGLPDVAGTSLDLDRGVTPSGLPLFPLPTSETGQLSYGGDMRLRTDVSVYAPGQTLAVKLRLAKDAVAEAWYVVDREGDGWAVSLLTPDRWLSESIESDLMHFGDPLEELVEEELAELGWRGRVPTIKHFRDDAKQYVFRSRVPLAAAPRTAKPDA